MTEEEERSCSFCGVEEKDCGPDWLTPYDGYKLGMPNQHFPEVTNLCGFCMVSLRVSSWRAGSQQDFAADMDASVRANLLRQELIRLTTPVLAGRACNEFWRRDRARCIRDGNHIGQHDNGEGGIWL